MSTPESAILTKILKHLEKQGLYCWRNQGGATYDAKLRGYRSNVYAKKGVGDIICILGNGSGRHVEIEVKAPKGKQSPDQKIHEKRVTELGGVYVLAKSVADVDNALDQT
jgi:hypothetical protein